MTITLAKENLSENGKKQRQNIVNQIKSLKDEFPALQTQKEWTSSNGNLIENSGNTFQSHYQ